ncbi:MAG: hypothetical protein KDD58_10040 [Bdellovibrionales bacterium]|nr:hypothetical protein [Bdellovibrionales bacterium]
MNIKVLRPRDIDHIINFEKDLLLQEIEDDTEREFAAWQAPWRVEALEHYLPLGWSFAAWEGDEGDSPLLGYFLAQPFLFYKGMTQSLWLEHLQSRSENIKNELLDLAYRLCREKHFQQLLLTLNLDFDKEKWQGFHLEKQPDHYSILTSKIVR